MGKGPLILIIIGLFPLLLALVLTIIPVISPTDIPNPSNMAYDWFSGIVRAFVIGLLFVVSLGFIVLGLIIAKRDSE